MSLVQPFPTNPHPRASSRPGIPLSARSIGWVTGAGDLILILVAAVGTAAAYHRLILGRSFVDFERYLAVGAICFLIFAGIATAKAAYDVEALVRFRRQAGDVAAAWTIVVAVGLSLVFVLKAGEDISRGAVALFLLTAPVALIAWRRVVAHRVAQALEFGSLRYRRVIMISDRDELARSNAVTELESVGYDAATVLTFQGAPSPATLRDLAEQAIAISRSEPIDAVMILASWSEFRVVEQIAQSLRVLPLPVHLLPNSDLSRLLRRGTISVAGLTAIEIQRPPLSAFEQTIKRTFDVVTSSIGLLTLSPVLLAIAVMIKLDSAGPVLFWQTRNGFNGKPFRIAKFRSMHVAEDGPEIRQATQGDARVTRLGRVLRKTSIDELPQLWNVLKGEMSVIGPRPHAVAHNEQYQRLIGNYAFRQHVKPGLSGWAQVHGWRGETSGLEGMERRVEHDLYYINNWSLWLDIKIVLATVRVVLRDPTAF